MLNAAHLWAPHENELNQSRNKTSHLLSQPPSTSTRHRHGRHTKITFLTEEGYSEPVEREKTQSGHKRNQHRREENRFIGPTSATKASCCSERSRQRREKNQHGRTPSPFEGSISSARRRYVDMLFQLLCLIISSNHVDTSTLPDNVPGGLHPSEGAEKSGAAKRNESSWKSTASTIAKLLLRGVSESAGTFGPLKSVAGGLCFILQNFEVWSSSHMR